MGSLNSLLGNASDFDISEVAKQLASIVVDTESLLSVFRIERDMSALTNKCLAIFEKQGMTCRKVDYHSIPRYDPI
jgi:hypothetical protein